MNIKDVVSPPAPGSARLIAEEIYTRQEELEDSYWKIEKRPAKVVSINSREGQVLVKDFLWRAVEEVGEALEKKGMIKGGTYDGDSFDEEMADGFHFVTGLAIITGNKEVYLRAFEFAFDPTTISVGLDGFITAAGTLGNCLKLKPWKQTDVPTDEKEFRTLLFNYVFSYIRYWDVAQEMLYDRYWRKSEVNLFRIRSKY